jgi:hypothetical protein
MNRDRVYTELPAPVSRYFEEVARMEPPSDLMDGAITEIELRKIQMQTAVNRFAFGPILAAVAATAVLIAAVAVGANLLSRNQTGNKPAASDLPIASVPQVASPSLEPGALIPEELRARFNGTDPSEPGSIEFTATTFRYIDQNGATMFRSDAALVGPDVIRLIATNVADCGTAGHVGTYRFSLSADGKTLTMAAAAEDPCGGRSFRTAGYWERRR